MTTPPAETGETPGSPRRVAIVGPCAAGKSTLARALDAAGFDTKQPAQEHSFVPYMWQRFTQPDVLIYLDVDYATAKRRSPRIDGGPEHLAEQHRRLAHAYHHCDLYLDTSGLTPEQVTERVLDFLSS